MSKNELDDTQKNLIPEQDNSETVEVPEETQKIQVPQREASEKLPAGRRWRWGLGILLGLIVFIALGALGGMQSGLQAREDQERLDRAVEAVAQFELGQNDLNNGQCSIARQRFEYVIELNATFPGVAEKLAEAILCSGIDAAPVAIATLLATSTPDARSASEIFAQASGFFAAGNWNELLPLLDTLRDVDVDEDYEAVRIDGMYYTALRNRGVNRILALGELEGGIFDLNQAEQIGPLDIEAADYRQWAVLYIIGQSFWDVDWGQAVQYFSQIAAVAPNLSDANFYTAADRLNDARIEYAKDLITSALFIAGAKGWCEADQIMREANGYDPHSPEIQPTADWIAEKCQLNPNEEADLN